MVKYCKAKGHFHNVEMVFGLSINIILQRITLILIDFEGKTVTVRRCQQAKGKSGLCEDVHILEAKTRMCYCDTDGCNGTNNLHPSYLMLLSCICGVLKIMSLR